MLSSSECPISDHLSMCPDKHAPKGIAMVTMMAAARDQDQGRSPGPTQASVSGDQLDVPTDPLRTKCSSL